MNWLKKGPELKLPKLKKPSLKRGGGGEGGSKGPSIKPPAFLADLYYDMRDRRLLPLVALVLVAIVAVPFLMGSDPEPLPPVSAGASPEAATANVSKLTVVEATPGLRDYRKRLKGRSATDPFEQQYTESTGGGGSEGGSGSTGESSSGSSSAGDTSLETGGGSSDGGETSPGAATGGNGTGGGTPDTGGLRLIEYRYTIQVSHTEGTPDGGLKMSEPQVRQGVRPLAQLPGEKLPLITVAGVNLENGRVYFLVSRDVTSLEGDFVCKARTPDGVCELLEVEAGFPFETIYGDGERYRFKVTDIDAIWGKKLGGNPSSARAAFGAPAASALPKP